MSVYIFEKSLLDRLDESANVLKCKETNVPAGQVHSEWAYHVELQLEPAGWQALWKISRALCEVYNIKYPTVVAGTVTNVDFRNLCAEFTVSAVQDDDVHIPEKHSVPLVDLWPTKEQENAELNIERTADCIDQLRFFYRNVWMPWDDENDDDLDWFDKHLDSRIRFCFDLKRTMSRAMADHIRMLLAEARYIQSRREVLETELEDSDMEIMDEDSTHANAKNLMRLHLRLTLIKAEVELLENPDTRRMYEDIHFPEKPESDTPNNYIVSRNGTIPQHLSYLEAVKKCIPDDKSVKIVPSLQDCLKICAPFDHIYIPVGKQKVNPVRVLNSNGSIKAIFDGPTSEAPVEDTEPNPAKAAVIGPIEDDSFLLSFNGAYTLENVTLDCRNVRLGLWLRNGSVTLKNCILWGDAKSATSTGIRVSNGAILTLINCTIKQFACGISGDASANITFIDTKLVQCENGIEVTDETLLSIKTSAVNQSSAYGFVVKSGDNTKRVCSDFAAAKAARANLSNITGEFQFADNQKGNVLIVRVDHCDALQNSEYIEDSFDVDNVSIVEVKDDDKNDDVILIE